MDGDGGDSSASLSVFPSLEVTDFILKCGFDVHSRNYLQETPLHIACKTENFSSDVAIKLLEYGAHLDTPDVRDICPIGEEHAFKIYDKFTLPRILYDRVQNRKNHFEIPAFLQIEQGKSRAGKFKTSNENKNIFVFI